MSSVASMFVLATLIFISGLVAALGGVIAFRLRNSKKKFTIAHLVCAMVLTIIGFAILAVNSAGGFWLVPVTVGMAITCQLVVRTAVFGQITGRLLATASALSGPGRWGVALMGLSALLFVGGFWQVNAMTAISSEPRLESHVVPVPDLEMDPMLVASTDHGVRVPLYKLPGGHEDSQVNEHNHGQLLENSPSPYRAVRLSHLDNNSNSAGWVFAEAQRWILYRDVPQILKDNDYHAVSVPVPGDLAIYRDNRGAITHVAQVVTLLKGNRPLIESEWEYQGVFLHLAEGTPYGPSFQYYHSPRSGHMLAVSNLHDQSGRSASDVAP